jgi:hypothetical protein
MIDHTASFHQKLFPTGVAELSSAYNGGMNDLNIRIALVTGASRGIGAGIALALARAGASVGVMRAVFPTSV